MKNIVLILVLLSVSCAKRGVTPLSHPTSVIQAIRQDGQLVIFNAMLNRTGIDTLLAGGPYTVFAPVDSAFLNAGISLEALHQYSNDSLRTLVSFLVVKGRVSSKDIIGFIKQNFTSLDTADQPIISKNYFGLFFDGIHVDEENTSIPDGVVNKMGTVGIPPARNLYQLILQNPDLTIFSAILRQNISLPTNNNIGLDQLLQFPADTQYYDQNSQDVDPNAYSDGLPPQPLINKMTLLVPSDEAFRAAGYSIDSVNNLDANTVAGLVDYGIIGNPFFTSDFEGGFRINGGAFRTPTVANAYTYVGLPMELGINGDGTAIYGQFSYAANTFLIGTIITANIVAKNGILHITNTLIIPPK